MAKKVSKIDVLIVGAGPAGHMLCTWMARMGIKTRIVDKRFDRVNSGQADGLQSRTFEILDSLGIGQDIWRQANHMLEIRFWNPDERGAIHRSGMIVDTSPGLSRFQQATLHQGIIEDHLMGYVKQHSDIQVEYGLMPESLSIDTEQAGNPDAYPVSCTVRQLVKEKPSDQPNEHGGSSVPNGLYRSNLAADTTDQMLQSAKENESSSTEEILAKYVVGCDGAHSWTRRQIGSVMEGEQTDFIWGVLDIIPITNFPDIRYRCAIHSAAGSMMVIPRENKYVRLYIQITQTDESGKVLDRHQISPKTLTQAAQKILSPYKFSFKHCHWWTAYRIGQRVGSKFSANRRVFLAGDAVHTHSPKAGQGMNISMHDTFNLGWKLASVIQGRCSPSLLETYDLERRQIAQELIDFDHQFSRLFSGRPAQDILDKEGIDLKTFQDVFEKGNLFASGIAVNYRPNMIVIKPGKSEAAEKGNGAVQHVEDANGSTYASDGGKRLSNIEIGSRMPSHKILNQSDARPWHLQELLPSNGAWRILFFAGNILDEAQLSRVKTFAEALDAPSSFLKKHTKLVENWSSVFELITIHSAPRVKVELLSLPDILHPWSDEFGWDYNKVFVDDMSYHEGHGQAYKNYGIDASKGCVVIVRPDQYVSWIGEMEDVEEMNKFFGAFMLASS
ncbi:uncharacterized protein Z520_11677 [Fonsecaea multimorphosa CBS 102226]|uniref:Phenol 2-monooxygenase n=1 Tax=Fonsecaea multimorphosa CBS 102226 TaxID=1442371 RepID=A0A0D2K8H1_9EURO|nr:uncharacterized protein Z520_11677 [Fonsecaea multimorphosa CBS 102226]KIX92648.1 hypothetical protein Z520_11677 [Fonsecaea multimorphosa CBS 102226]